MEAALKELWKASPKEEISTISFKNLSYCKPRHKRARKSTPKVVTLAKSRELNRENTTNKTRSHVTDRHRVTDPWGSKSLPSLSTAMRLTSQEGHSKVDWDLISKIKYWNVSNRCNGRKICKALANKVYSSRGKNRSLNETRPYIIPHSELKQTSLRDNKGCKTKRHVIAWHILCRPQEDPPENHLLLPPYKKPYLKDNEQ